MCMGYSLGNAGMRMRTMDLMLLRQLLRHGERCSGELAREAEKYTAQAETFGLILPLLWKLQKHGLIQARWIAVEQRQRKQYRLTETGVAAYQEGMYAIEAMLRELRV